MRRKNVLIDEKVVAQLTERFQQRLTDAECNEPNKVVIFGAAVEVQIVVALRRSKS
jgi:hypothetical protein